MKRGALQIGEGNEKAKNRFLKVGASVKIIGKFLTKTNLSKLVREKKLKYLTFGSVTFPPKFISYLSLVSEL